MSRKHIIALILMISGVGVTGQVNFIEVTNLAEMEVAQKKASDQQLMMYVDVYATWCGPCKLMDKNVYTDPSVAEYMNANFVNVRLDGETDYGRIYAKAQQLKGYPSMFIFSRDGDPVSNVVGFTAADELLTTLVGTVDRYRVAKIYKTKYERGTLETGEFEEYITVVREMGNQGEAEELAAEYIERIIGTKLTGSDIRVVAFYMDMEDAWWPEFSSDKKRLKDALGDDYMLAIEKIYNNTLLKAVDEDKIQLISKMSNELTPLVDVESTSSWDLRSLPFLQYYYYTNQVEELIKYVDKRYASDRQGDHRWLYGAASQITDMDQQYLTEALLKKGVEWFQTCLDQEENFDYYFYHGMVLFFLKKKEEAKASFLSAESLASNEEQHHMIGEVLEFVDKQ